MTIITDLLESLTTPIPRPPNPPWKTARRYTIHPDPRPNTKRVMLAVQVPGEPTATVGTRSAVELGELVGDESGEG